MYGISMLKHKLYLPSSCSFSLGMTPNQNESQSVKSKGLCTFEQGLKRRNITGTPISSKMMKSKSNSPECEIHPSISSKTETPKPGTSRNIKLGNESVFTKVPEDVNEENDLMVLKDDFDSPVIDYFSKFNLRLPYTSEEDELILKFVLKGQNIFKVSSLSLWKQLEIKKDNPKRTYQSLKNRFLRNIKPNLLTTYKHLIKDQETLERILVKFPELKKQMGVRKFLNIKVPALDTKSSEGALELTSSSKDCESSMEKSPEPQTPVPDDKVNNSRSPSSPLRSPKTSVAKRTVKLCKNIITVSINVNELGHSKASLSPSFGLNERFKKLTQSKERVLCPTCGRMYTRPFSKNFSGSDAESDILIPDSVDAGENSGTEIVGVVGKTQRKSDLKMSPCSEFSNSSGSQNLLISLEKSDKSCRDSDESNGAMEENCEKENNEIEEVWEVLKESNSGSEKISEEEKNTDNDSDVELIYENTVARFQKLINADEEKTLQRTCLHRNRDSIGFNANLEKNLDSFFLDSSMELETPASTKDNLTQVEVRKAGSANNEVHRKRCQSTEPQRTRLVSNMMRMLAQKPERKS